MYQGKTNYKFTKGQQVHMDTIYPIQGLFNECEWWTAIDPAEAKIGDNEELVTIMRCRLLI